MSNVKIDTTGWTKEQVEELEKVIERNSKIADTKVKLQRVSQGAVFIPAPEECEVVKELEASGNDGKAVGSIKLVYSEKLLINTELNSQYNIEV